MGRLRPLTVLIAEDDHLLRVLLMTVLRRQGYRVFQAADGIRAVRLLAEEDVDVLLLDVNLGSDDGVSLGYELRAQHPELPIALMSGDSSEPEAMRRASGFTDTFLPKPFTPELVSAAIERLARARRPHER
jgi:DNA-binding response OmpR family regulator